MSTDIRAGPVAALRGEAVRQSIPPHTITQLSDRPEVSVVQRSEANSWVEVQADGSLLLGPCSGALWEWEAFVRTAVERWTTDQAAEHCGVKPSTYRSYITRFGAPAAVEREPGRGGQDLYDATGVRAWQANRAGQGARTDLRTAESAPPSVE